MFEKVAVTPAGKPVTDSATGALNAPTPLTVRTADVLDPCVTLAAATLAFIVKLGAAVTVTVKDRVL